MADHIWNVYLAGEIHSDWRRKIIEGVRRHKLPIEFGGPVTDHTASDTCGEKILGTASDSFWRDHRAANINAIRTSGLIRWADIVVISFSEKYRQWNAAFDAGFAAALGKAIITLHPTQFDHALKEVDSAARVTTRTPEQVVEVLVYVVQGGW